ncbi:MAG: parvulin-like peptidyl-prolyl isomerase [Saprospiraceae bacterium]|jgi:parvulin-like peptidyl-prolyl isomerase
MIQRVIKEPLVHFLILGFLVFVWFEHCNSSVYNEEEDTIVVSKEQLVTLMQYQSKAFQPSYFDQQYAAMNEDERQELIDNYINEEVLYRESLKYNLDDNDYIIKRRLIQKVNFLYDNMIEEGVGVSEDSLKAYYEAHLHEYKKEANYSFSHVFVKPNSEASDLQETKAQSLLDKLNKAKIDANTGTQYGDRFLYHKNYIDRDLEFIKSHFGDSFGSALSALEVDDSKWRGPIVSDHGYHLVLALKKEVERQESYEEVRGEVTKQYQRREEKEIKDTLLEEVIGNYKVVIDL